MMLKKKEKHHVFVVFNKWRFFFMRVSIDSGFVTFEVCLTLADKMV
jgi:hypothetical protein